MKERLVFQIVEEKKFVFVPGLSGLCGMEIGNSEEEHLCAGLELNLNSILPLADSYENCEVSSIFSTTGSKQ